jgi:hypothetical protein
MLGGYATLTELFGSVASFLQGDVERRMAVEEELALLRAEKAQRDKEEEERRLKEAAEEALRKEKEEAEEEARRKAAEAEKAAAQEKDKGKGKKGKAAKPDKETEKETKKEEATVKKKGGLPPFFYYCGFIAFYFVLRQGRAVPTKATNRRRSRLPTNHRLSFAHLPASPPSSFPSLPRLPRPGAVSFLQNILERTLEGLTCYQALLAASAPATRINIVHPPSAFGDETADIVCLPSPLLPLIPPLFFFLCSSLSLSYRVLRSALSCSSSRRSSTTLRRLCCTVLRRSSRS